MNLKILSVLAWLLVSTNSYAIEKFSCGGTEPFWSLELTDYAVVYRNFDDKPVRYLRPNYTSAGATSIDLVMQVKAGRGRATFSAFVDSTTMLIVTAKDGKAPSDGKEYSAYCSDGMSDRLYPYSINAVVEGKTVTGCCETASRPAIEAKY